MNQAPTKQKESFTVAARLSPELKRLVEAEMVHGGFINKSRFIEAAIREYIEVRQGKRQLARQISVAQN
jgi:hypothetical protein